jgi:hypothetical protein
MVAGLTALSSLACCRAWSPLYGSGKIDHRPYTPERDPTRGGTAVTFTEVLAQVIDGLQQEKHLSSRALQRPCALDDDDLDALKAALIEVRQACVPPAWKGGARATVVIGTPACAFPLHPVKPTRRPHDPSC